jgi:hypothetical protein
VKRNNDPQAVAPRERKDARMEAVKALRALGRRMNLRITQAEIRRAITRGQA